MSVPQTPVWRTATIASPGPGLGPFDLVDRSLARFFDDEGAHRGVGG
jgi:hypothetical protein